MLSLVFALAGGGALMVDAVTPGVWWVGWVWLLFGPLLFAVHQPVLEAAIAAGRVEPELSLATRKELATRSWPWLLFMFASVALPTAVGLAGFLFGFAFFWAAEAWCVDRWEKLHSAEVLEVPGSRRFGREFYVRSAPGDDLVG